MLDSLCSKLYNFINYSAQAASRPSGWEVFLYALFSKEGAAMIVVMKPDATKEQIRSVEERLQKLGFKTHPIYGEKKTVIGAVGDKSQVDASSLSHMEGVEAIVPIMKPYKLVGRELKREPTVVDVGSGVKIGGDELVVIAGPCAIEGEEQIYKVAKAVKKQAPGY